MKPIGYDEARLVSGEFVPHENQAYAYTRYLFLDKKKGRTVSTECRFQIDFGVTYILLVSLEDNLNTYRVIKVIERADEVQRERRMKKSIQPISEKSNEPSSRTEHNELGRLLNVTETPYVVLSDELRALFQQKRWRELVYDAKPFLVQPDVLATYLPKNHPLVAEARVLLAFTNATKRERCVWLTEDQLFEATRIANYKDVRDRMIRKSELTWSPERDRLALTWAAKQAENFKKKMTNVTLKSAPYGTAHETRVVNKALEKKALTPYDFTGNRKLSVDYFVDRKQVVMTMCNDREWIEESYCPTLTFSPLTSVRDMLMSVARRRLGLLADDPVRAVLDFLKPRGMTDILFAFAYDSDFDRCKCEREYPEGKRVLVKRDDMIYSRLRSAHVHALEGPSSYRDLTINGEPKRFNKNEFKDWFPLQTCRETQLLNLKEDSFQVVVLFVQCETHYRWILEADRVAGDGVLLIAQAATNDFIARPSHVGLETDDVNNDHRDDEGAVTNADENTLGPYDLASSSSRLPTVRDLMREVRSVMQCTSATRQTGASVQHGTNGAKRIRFMRSHEVVYQGNGQLTDLSVEGLESVFESKISPIVWTRKPQYELNKEKTRLQAYCGARCGSKRHHQPIYSMGLQDGMIVKFTEFATNVTHSAKCLELQESSQSARSIQSSPSVDDEE